MKVFECVECGANVELGNDVIVGEIAQCNECGAELEVVSLDPPKTELCPEEEEDWGE